MNRPTADGQRPRSWLYPVGPGSFAIQKNLDPMGLRQGHGMQIHINLPASNQLIDIVMTGFIPLSLAEQIAQ